MSLMELHIHSTFSDGEQTPEEILQAAQLKGVRLLAFTDHDEIGAYHQARELAMELGIHLIPGIELNTDGVDGELHILGYFFDPDHPQMVRHIEWRKEERKMWAEEITRKLQMLNYNVTFTDVLKKAPGDIIVRTHIAQALVEKGYFHSAQDAYHNLLVKGKPAFVNREAFSAQDAVFLIHACGGKAFLAHPGAYSFSFDERAILAYGIDGIEVYHSKHSENDVCYWMEFSEKHRLLKSGGSDSHGPKSRNPFPIGSIQPDDETKEHWLERVGVSL
ncbi:PHP domain-containing protein [Oceanobacillus damuensis]|uniref:PHP domain-containing protein n=1 Tax=Oceanobacillus damuensis TaxID=937928 RepID=UPI0008371FA5|nr:PHP domain-containing protein [Oceanobacillus damuensis]